ncbi:hypothetical protein GGX14DRAFT_450381 [Mycena pura]|uniref:F-box domain-containing protein n=1 Tax=Mycena pura TaxID=153505 RepID=A0AAD6YAX8_9AGAR|nr:hypothetical protein GGX14DRAFT_450381 [Mycena pura]
MSNPLVAHISTKELLVGQPPGLSTLPFELADLIIGHIRDNREALSSCSLVSRAWLHITRPYFFESVILSDKTCARFLRLKASPCCTFIPHIKSLSISRPEEDQFSGTFSKLVPKFAGFPSLVCLKVFHVYWTDLAAASVAAFIAAFHDITQLDIQHATFDTPHQLMALLTRLPRLETVTVHTKFHSDRSWMPAPALSDPPRSLQVVRLCLDCIGYDPWSGIIGWIVTGPPTIRELRLGEIWGKNLPSVGTLLRTLGFALRELDLQFVSSITTGEIERDLAPHLTFTTHIRHLTLRFSVYERNPGEWYSSLAFLAALTSEPAALETLTLVLKIWMLDFVRELTHFDWAPLQAAVRAHTQLRLLRFQVYNRYSNSSRNGTATVEKIFKSATLEFAVRGSVEMEWNEWQPWDCLYPGKY